MKGAEIGGDGLSAVAVVDAARDFYFLCASEGFSDYTADQGALAAAYARLGKALAVHEFARLVSP